MRVLVAEDDLDFAIRISGLLLDAGCRLTTVRNGRAAWRALQEAAPFDVVLLNWMLPLVDGWRIAQQLSKSSNSRAVVVLLVGRRHIEELRAISPTLADELLAKPCTQPELQTVLTAAMDRARLRTREAEPSIVAAGAR